MNQGTIPEYLGIGRIVALSKDKNSENVEVTNIRPVVIKSHIFKIMEKTILNKIKSMAPHLIKVGTY